MIGAVLSVINSDSECCKMDTHVRLFRTACITSRSRFRTCGSIHSSVQNRRT